MNKSQLKEVKFGDAGGQRVTEVGSAPGNLEDAAGSKPTSCHVSDDVEGQNPGNKDEENPKTSKLRVNASRSSFEQQDLFVPWRYRGAKTTEHRDDVTQGSANPDGPDVGHVYHRYYHVFQEGELVKLCGRLDNVRLRDCYYEKGNWSVLLEKC